MAAVTVVVAAASLYPGVRSSPNTLYRELRCCRGVVATRFPFPRIDEVDSPKVPYRYQHTYIRTHLYTTRASVGE